MNNAENISKPTNIKQLIKNERNEILGLDEYSKIWRLSVKTDDNGDGYHQWEELLIAAI